MTLLTTEFEGLFVLQPNVFRDQRGTFVKTFHRGIYQKLGIEFEPAESFFSVSKKGALRGMHFQTPPAAHAKTVTCIAGRILDVVVDLRKSSPQYGKAYSRELDSERAEVMFIPIGFAHGFVTLSDEATVFYQTSTEHSPQHDQGIHWNSFGFVWPAADNLIISERDSRFPKFSTFQSPF